MSSLELKRCENCDQIFCPEGNGLLSILCWICATDCEESCYTLLRYIRRNEVSDIEDKADLLARETNVPPVFVDVLMKAGRLNNSETMKEQGNCRRCGIKLCGERTDICTDCSQNLLELIQQNIREAALQAPSFPQSSADLKSALSKSHSNYGIRRRT